MSRLSLRLATLAAALALAGCYPRPGPLPGPLSEAALSSALGRLPGQSAETLAKGRAQAEFYCQDCHEYPDIWVIAAEKWPAIMKRMQKEADMTQEDADLVLNFILAAQSDPRPASTTPSPAPKPKKK